VRNCLLFAALAALCSVRLPPGPALLPGVACALTALVLVSADGYVAEPQTWNWLAQVRSSPEQVLVSGGLWAVAVASIWLRRPRI
jgi:hypothetical protein